MAQNENNRTAFFISDSTGIAAEAFGLSLLAQFSDTEFTHVRLPFVSDVERAQDCLTLINKACERDNHRPIVFSTLVQTEVVAIIEQADAKVLNFFSTFITPLEDELGVRSTHTVGRFNGTAESETYKKRIEAIDFTLAHDDGLTGRDLDRADVILVGVSRSGKTPTSIYLAMHYGIKAANYPLIPEDFERNELPSEIVPHQNKIYGLTIQPERLHNIREERLPDSRYASLNGCLHEIEAAKALMRRKNISYLDATSQSIEEISAKIMQEFAKRNESRPE